MGKALKKLYLGDIVASGTTKQLRKLTTNEPQDNSLIGTWVFNDVLSNYASMTVYDATTCTIDADIKVGSYTTYTSIKIESIRPSTDWLIYATNYDTKVYTDADGWLFEYAKTVTINSIDTNNPKYDVFATWVKVNARKIA